MKTRQIILALTIMCSCAVVNAQPPADAIRISEVEVTHTGETVELRFLAEIGSQAVGRDYLLRIFPELVRGESRARFGEIMIRGRRTQKGFERKGNDATAGFAVQRHGSTDAVNGGSIEYRGVVPYGEWMREGCDLRLAGELRALSYAAMTDLGIIVPQLRIYEEVRLVWPDGKFEIIQ